MTLADDITTLMEAAARLDQQVHVPDSRDGLTLPERITECFQGWPQGSGYDRKTRRTVLHCDTHGEDDCECGRNTPIPSMSDPTGEAAMRGDRARDDLKAIERHVKAASVALVAALDVAARYQLRSPNVLERKDTTPQAGCTSCARVPGPSGAPYWSPVYRSTTLTNGIQVDLCQPCYSGPDGSRHTGELPPTAAVEARRDGKRWRGAA